MWNRLLAAIIIVFLEQFVISGIPAGCCLAMEEDGSEYQSDEQPSRHELLDNLFYEFDFYTNYQMSIWEALEKSEFEAWSIHAEDFNSSNLCKYEMTGVDGDIEIHGNLGRVIINSDVECTGTLFIHHGTSVVIVGDLTVGRGIFALGGIEVTGSLYAGEPDVDAISDYVSSQEIKIVFGDLICGNNVHSAGGLHIYAGSVEAENYYALCMIVDETIWANGDINCPGAIRCESIISQGNLSCDMDVLALRGIEVEGDINVGWCVACASGWLIAGGDIYSGYGISVGGDLEAGGLLDCPGIIRVGTLATAITADDAGVIRCRELVKGDIKMGILEETGGLADTPPE